MTRANTKGWLAAIGVAATLVARASGQQATSQTETLPTAGVSRFGRVIVVSLEDRRLALVEDGKAKKIYTVAVGKPSTPSPEGTFTIERRVRNPVYRHDGQTIEPCPANPVGSRWMGLSIHGYGIHGTNAPKSIGKAASHGCIRMGKADLEELYEMVEVGDQVKLIGHRDEETIALFNPVPTVAPPSVITAIQTAKALGLERGHLDKKCQQLGIDLRNL